MQAFFPAYGEVRESPRCLSLSSQGSAKVRQEEERKERDPLACCLGVVDVKKKTPLPPGHQREERRCGSSAFFVFHRDGWMELLTCQHTLEEEEEEKVGKVGRK